LYVFARAGWTTMFLCMATLLALTVLPALALREPANDRPGVRAGFKELAFGWMTRLKTPGVLVLNELIAGYRFGDSMVASLIGPFMRDYGLTKESIALIKGTVGSLASLAAAILGGGFAYLVGRRTALFACGLAQTASLGFYVLAAFGIGGVAMIWAGNVAEHLLGGMATVAVFTLMMDASDPEHAGTDYTLFACAIVFVTGIANFTGASIADAFGYAPTFVLGMILSGIGCLVLVASLDARRGPARVAAVWHATPGRIAVGA
ncbi:MAG TPA: MFS transporter, partial [Steroidobacteraceae bacterium]|nr:MFS transporter [Steroidobacteraceae bacterium]